MRIWMEKETGELFLARPWYEPIRESSINPFWMMVEKVGWLIQAREGGAWLGGPQWVKDQFEDLGGFFDEYERDGSDYPDDCDSWRFGVGDSLDSEGV